ncbi:Gfo/Idh/MocA family protein [Streptomyces flaveolus]|uniref:Gfo/Idh/MocA family protein n=1 Tax=Streptomyces flaveolus TaxID=67297 RepID=UPI0033F3208F
MTPTLIPAVRPWRLAVAGCGAAAFGLHLPLLTASDAFDVIAVADRDPARARTAQKQFAVPRTATRVGDLLTDADVLVILTGVHEDLIEEALDAGVHVVTEKPVCLDVVRTRKLTARARDTGLLLEVGAMRAHDPALHTALTKNAFFFSGCSVGCGRGRTSDQRDDSPCAFGHRQHEPGGHRRRRRGYR